MLARFAVYRNESVNDDIGLLAFAGFLATRADNATIGAILIVIRATVIFSTLVFKIVLSVILDMTGITTEWDQVDKVALIVIDLVIKWHFLFPLSLSGNS